MHGATAKLMGRVMGPMTPNSRGTRIFWGKKTKKSEPINTRRVHVR